MPKKDLPCDGSTSLWMATPRVAYPPLDSNVHTDVAVIGAGIAGLSVAYQLAKEGVKVLVLDDGPIGGGESTRTTGHLSSALDDHFTHLEKVFKKKGAALAAQSHMAAIDTIERICKHEGIDCDFERLDGYLFNPPKQNILDLDKELAAAKRAGHAKATLVKRAPWGTFDTGPAIRFPRQAQIHITKYLNGLAKAAKKAGAAIALGTHVSDVKDGNKSVTLKTLDRHKVTAQSVVVATNAPIIDNALIYSRQAAYRTYVIGVAVPRGSITPALYWDTQEAYHYVRLAHNEHGKRDILIVGGEDHKTGQADDAGMRFAALERWMRERFPMAEDMLYKWSGQVMEPVDCLAFIGRKPLSTNVYIVTGDSGHGLTHGTIGGMLIRDLLLERDNPWEKLYDPARVKLKATSEFFRENANTAAQMKDVVTKEKNDTDDLLPGTGKIVGKRTKKLALYRDHDGRLHTFSAVCPHKGCIVRWNGFEKSWDCPCHGSRFSCIGEVLDGPSIADLKRVR